jgi:hypothetical protein
MPQSPPPSLESEILKLLRQAEEPLSADQIRERLPADLFAGVANPLQKVRNLLKQPEVGHVARGRYVYLPEAITGSTFRLPLTGKEAEDGYLRMGLELVYALWFRRIDAWGSVPEGSSAACELPDGTPSAFTVEEVVHNRRFSFSRVPLVAAGTKLRDWLHEKKAAAGDSVLVQITDGERSRCRVTLERLAERDRVEVVRRNEELADAAEHVLRNEIRGKPLSLYELTAWLLAREVYRAACPPDPLEVVLQGDRRFTPDGQHGRYALATKWEWARFQDLDFPPEMLEALKESLFGRRQEPETDPALSEADRRALMGIDPIEELQPWLEAVGYRASSREEPDEAAAAAGVAARREQVYQLRVALKRRSSTRRVIEARGDNTLVDLDDALRRAFRHDTMDHLGGFFVPTGGGRGQEELATINPLGEVVEGEDLELAQLNLEPGDELIYVYDFGDWVEHTIEVQAVVPPEPGVEYPREVEGRRTGKGVRRQ